MSVETNDGYGNREIINHAYKPSKNNCPKCKIGGMKPKYVSGKLRVQSKLIDYIDNLGQFISITSGYDTAHVKSEHIVWTCPECEYKTAKEIEP